MRYVHVDSALNELWECATPTERSNEVIFKTCCVLLSKFEAPDRYSFDDGATTGMLVIMLIY